MPENTDTTPHQHSATLAYAWAQRAEDHHTQADAARTRAAEQEDPRGTYAVRLLQQHEADLTRHTEQAATAMSMAEMWARVATAQRPANYCSRLKDSAWSRDAGTIEHRERPASPIPRTS